MYMIIRYKKIMYIIGHDIQVTITINIPHTADYGIKYLSLIHELAEVSIVLFLAIGTSARASAVLLLYHYFINRVINHVRSYLPTCFVTKKQYNEDMSNWK